MVPKAPPRRLERICGHLKATARAARRASAASTTGSFEGVLPLKLCPGLVDGQLTPLPASLEAVRQVMRESAEVRDYRKAVELQDLLYVAEKKELLTVEECAPPTPELCGEFFMQNGFVGTSEQSLPFRAYASNVPSTSRYDCVGQWYRTCSSRSSYSVCRPRGAEHRAQRGTCGTRLGSLDRVSSKGMDCIIRICHLGMGLNDLKSWPMAGSSSTSRSRTFSPKPATKMVTPS